MKTLSGKVNLAAFAIIGVSVVAMAVYAAETKKNTDPKTQGIRLIMGHKNNEPLHCTEESMNRALGKCDTKTYKIHYHDSKSGKTWDKGDMTDDVSLNDVTMPRKEIGGAAASPEEKTIGRPGVNSTQQISFSSTEDLKAFVSALESE